MDSTKRDVTNNVLLNIRETSFTFAMDLSLLSPRK